VASEAPRVIRSPTPQARAGALLADAIAATQARGGEARVAIPGGSALAALGAARRELGPRWAGVRLTWLDERCVPFAHADSNRGLAYRSGALDPGHPTADEIPLFDDGESGPEAAARAAAAIEARFDGALDVLLLGMGEDGHIASLFPGAWQGITGSVAFIADSPKPPPERVTLTRTLLASAVQAVLLATGEGKRRALERLIAGDATLPAHGLNGLVVVTDLDPAGGGAP
jgi:6-phosphogluconolactonase